MNRISALITFILTALFVFHPDARFSELGDLIQLQQKDRQLP
ncbi:hypothetical protein [Salisediminibacterium beveridgei]|nr:hypothetical protein [Salisediminibacterium beveridgei]